jgi:hypothetical protein
MWNRTTEGALRNSLEAELTHGSLVMDNSKPVDRPSTQTVKVRQGTGPRAMVSVLLVSLLLAAVAGTVLLFYFFAWPTSTP